MPEIKNPKDKKAFDVIFWRTFCTCDTNDFGLLMLVNDTANAFQKNRRLLPCFKLGHSSTSFSFHDEPQPHLEFPLGMLKLLQPESNDLMDSSFRRLSEIDMVS